MYLKRLELSGFKSFADKTELEFVRGITGVVGPNGSGKSNISDAIRWVLGEQSAKSLRGGKMEDIIFAGSDARKAVNYGEVSLTLDNSDEALPLDFHEVTVTRRVHRSGDSEYFINKQPCRLKDITELFMDTGIGKEAYSIIGQGRIEEILSTRSEDRRGIFEEASGIVKYKSRKKEAERKLDETEQNLLRIHDLISELEDQVEPLRRQAEKAKEFKALREQLKGKEISLYVHQIDETHRLWTEANAELERWQTEQLKLSAFVSRHDAELESYRLETRRMEAELDELQEELLKVSEKLEKGEGYGEVLKERQANLKENREQLQRALLQAAERIAAKRREREALQEKLLERNEKLEQLRQSLAEEERRLSGVAGGTSDEAEEQLKNELFEVVNRMANARNEIRYLDQQREASRRRQEKLEEETVRLDEQRAGLADRRQALAVRLNEAESEQADARNRYIRQSRELESVRKLFEEVQQTARKWEQKRDALVSRRDTMQEIEQDYDGFAQGVREVLKASRRPDGLRGVHGAVAELIRVPERMEVAVETALGAALQHIVMEDEASAREAIAFLKRRQLGRATFLPLTVIRSRALPESDRRLAAGIDGFVGVGAELVEYDPAYEAIIGSLLGNVIIAETLEQANRIAARCQYRYRIVTLEGDIVHAGGSMTGGSVQRKSSNLLGRRRQIEALNGEIAGANRQLAELRDRMDDLKKEQSILSQNLEQLRERGEALRLEEQRLKSELEALDGELARIRDQIEMARQERDNLSAEADALLQRKEEEAARLNDLEREERRLQEAIRQAELQRKANESAKDELQTHLTDLKVQTAALMQEKQSLADQIERLETEIGELETERQQNQALLERTDRELEQNRQESVRQLEQVNAARIRKQQLTEQLEFKRAERNERAANLEREESRTKEERARLREVEEAMRRTEIAANRLDVELDNLLKKLAEEYEISYELAKERYPLPEDAEQNQQEVRELKRRIAALGEVNPGAIEEYERVDERYRFLTEQKNDLMEAKAALYQVIREMDSEMSKRFRTTFEAIRRHFAVVFTKLFGGGRADLILVEPDKPLETGVDIVAQPPGKKLQNLQLLSGGERALTAIALLFAILLVKPVPFCVLDEVEAALDEANVARFAQYLREFSEQTQFIVVTHRKGTMEEADVLYGVTMEEGGVSKLVSVKLEEDEPVSA
jgi:chromosome segregation protein